MRLRLTRRPSAGWHDLGGGVTARIRPGGEADLELAQVAAQAKTVTALIGGQPLEVPGMALDTARLIEDGSAKHEVFELLLAVELGCALIEEWEGVGDEQGKPAPLERQWIAELLITLPAARHALWYAAMGHRETQHLPLKMEDENGAIQ